MPVACSYARRWRTDCASMRRWRQGDGGGGGPKASGPPPAMMSSVTARRPRSLSAISPIKRARRKPISTATSTARPPRSAQSLHASSSRFLAKPSASSYASP